MENKTIHLVAVYVNEMTGQVGTAYEGEHDSAKCLMKVSFRPSRNTIGIPLYFDSKEEADSFIEKAKSPTEKDFYIIQEFTGCNCCFAGEAKIIFNCKSDTWITMAEGKTERSPGVWANVRTLSVCDKAAAEDYVRRFNEDAKAASIMNVKCGK